MFDGSCLYLVTLGGGGGGGGRGALFAIRNTRGKGYSQSMLLKRAVLVTGALTTIVVLIAGLFPLSLVGWGWP